MKVLFIGGTGNISSACVALALARGHEVTLLNRGQTSQPSDPRVHSIVGDRNDLEVLRKAARANYDVVADFVGFTPDQVEKDIVAFEGHIGQYIYISSASAYQKPPNHYVITESTPLYNPFWQYSRDKIACEERLTQAYRERGFPITIVRPSYTYGETWIPCGVGGHGYTVVDRMRRGKPILSAVAGQSLWVMTHNSDFAVGFVGLFGARAAIGEAFHITSDEVLTWDRIYETMAYAAGCTPNIVHVSSDLIAALYPALAGGLWGDKAHSVVFDNSKIKRLVPEYRAKVSWAEGIARSIAWYDAKPEERHVVNHEVDALMDHIIAVQQNVVKGERPR